MAVVAGVAPPPPTVASLPTPLPLSEAVRAGVFGHDEGGPVEPGAEEVDAITRQHAELVTGLVAAFRRTAHSPGETDLAVRTAVEKYAADFGREAAGALLEYCHRRAVLEDGVPIRSPRRP